MNRQEKFSASPRGGKSDRSNSASLSNSQQLSRALLTLLVIGTVLFFIALVDRPLAAFAAAHRVHVRGLQFVIGIPGLLLGVALAVPIVGWIFRMLAPGWRRIVVPCSSAIIWTGAAVELVLKPIFGRTGPFNWLDHNQYAFHWLRGRIPQWQSMPSGEAAILGATFGVLWIVLPRWRWAYVLVGGLEALGLVWFQWHFASDVIAGAAVGILGAG